MHRVLQADARIEKPFPRRAGDDERKRHRIEIDRPEYAFAPDLLVEQDGERQADDRADADIEDAEECQVLERDVPVPEREQPGVIVEPVSDRTPVKAMKP
jgi:hypothetical protein